MKKIYIVPLTLFFLSTMTSNIFAADTSAATSAGGDVVTISAASTGGSDLVFDPSPNTLMGYYITDLGVGFAVNSISAAALAGGDAIEYGMAFDTNQVIKTERASTYTFVVPTAGTSAGL